MSAPSVSYSITVRLEVPAGGSAVSQLTATMEALGGSVTALDVIHSDADRLGIDVTLSATSKCGAVDGGFSDRRRDSANGFRCA